MSARGASGQHIIDFQILWKMTCCQGNSSSGRWRDCRKDAFKKKASWCLSGSFIFLNRHFFAKNIPVSPDSGDIFSI
jgi:hypothetical protein